MGLLNFTGWVKTFNNSGSGFPHYQDQKLPTAIYPEMLGFLSSWNIDKHLKIMNSFFIWIQFGIKVDSV